MTQTQFNSFAYFRNEFRNKVKEWSAYAEQLIPFQKAAAQKDTPDYPLETSVVYNRALDEINQNDEIKLIVIGDNPGKDEQLLINNKYLVGQSGKIAEGFFRRNSELKTDFRKNVIILNKTPIHTAKTNHLRFLQKSSEEIAQLILESQIWMAKETALLHQELITGNADTQLWLVGYSELKGNGIFLPYRDTLKDAYKNNSAWNSVYVYQHFSMNRFLVDLHAYQEQHTDELLSQSLITLGHLHRDEIFGK